MTWIVSIYVNFDQSETYHINTKVEIQMGIFQNVQYRHVPGFVDIVSPWYHILLLLLEGVSRIGHRLWQIQQIHTFCRYARSSIVSNLPE